MQMETNQNSLIEQAKSMSIFVKALLVGGLSLLLLIPLAMTSSIVDERKDTANKAIAEVSDKWGTRQSVLAPMLRIPYNELDEDNKTNTRYVWITPKSLNIAADVKTQIRRRSIYKIPVYTSEIKLMGSWDLSILREENFSIGTLRLGEAKIFLGLHDVKGFKDYVYVNVNGKSVGLRPDKSTGVSDYTDDYYDYDDSSAPTLMPALLSSSFPLDIDSVDQTFQFSSEFTFTGSQILQLAPIGRSNEIRVKSNWADPSFVGVFLPESSDVRPDGFEAQWGIVEYNRGYGNLLSDSDISSVMAATASVNFIQPINEYSQSDRSIKYGILIILLSFVAIFFIEMSLKQQQISINLFHYMLVGLALVLFYTLLLSISEIIGFGWAYLVATIMTIFLVGLYFRSILPPSKSAFILVGILAFLYLFVYMLIQLTTYALLVGSLGLFVILALVMYVSSRLIK